jgi:hypothetical protein
MLAFGYTFWREGNLNHSECMIAATCISPKGKGKKRLGDQTTSTKKRAVIPGQEHNIQ